MFCFIIAYLDSFLNLLHGVQSCNNNHLLLGADCTEDHPLLVEYTKQLTKEMEAIHDKRLTTERGRELIFKFDFIPVDMTWLGCINMWVTEQCSNLLLVFCECE